MKKNAMLKIAAILMVAVLLTTCAISSTFAKYVTKAETGDTKTGVVAKWDLAISATEGVELFKKGYDDALSASADGATYIMAPGTSSEADLGFSISGSPEVAFKVVVDPTVTLQGWTLSDSSFYCPVKFTVNDTEEVTLTTADDVADLEAAIANAILAGEDSEGNPITVKTKDGKYYAEYEPNTAQFATAKTVKLAWEWAFYVDDATDDKDTELGKTGHANSVTIAYTISAEQIAKIGA